MRGRNAIKLIIWLLAAWLAAGVQLARAQSVGYRPGGAAARAAAEETALAWELLRQHRWLELLSQPIELARRHARLVLLDRQHEQIRQQLARLPDPAATIVSAEKDQRARRRAAMEHKLGRLGARIRQLEQSVPVDGTRLLLSGLRRPSRAGHWTDTLGKHPQQVGRYAVEQELSRRSMAVRLVRDHHVAGHPRAWRVLVDGAPVPVDSRGVVLEELLDRFTHPVHTELREVFFAAIDRDRAHLIRSSPAQARALLDLVVRDGLQQQLDASAGLIPAAPGDATQREIAGVIAHRRQVAGQMAAATRQALAPFSITLAMLVPGGPVELMLEVLPVTKLGRKAAHLARTALAARRARRTHKQALRIAAELAQSLDEPARDFLRLTDKLGRAELAALRTVHRHTHAEQVVMRLVHQRDLGNVNLPWLARRLERKQLEPTFVRRFCFDADLVQDYTLYDANPSWRVLQALAERRPVTAGQRASLASKVTGLLGERAAVDLVREPAVAACLLGRAGARLDPQSGIWAHQNGFDIVALSDQQQVLVGEVKNWSVQTWQSPHERNRVLQQLRRHDAKLPALVKELQLLPADVAVKVLFVAEEGFIQGLDIRGQEGFKKSIGTLGWRLELIPSGHIMRFGEFIKQVK